jgi:nicotinate-nucleotide adenylyltransferase
MIGVLGGTFDPVHFGHLRPALEVRQALGLEELRLIPLRQAVHRSQPQASPEQRLAMLRLAVQGGEGLVIDDRELRRAGESYTYETLVDLRREVGRTERLCLLVGADAFRGFLSWHRPDDILVLAHLIVMRRPAIPEAGGQAPEEVPDTEFSAQMKAWLQPRRCLQVGDLTASPAGRVWFQEVTQLAISATRIRGLVASGLSPRYLLPDPVLDYILRQRLYGGS